MPGTLRWTFTVNNPGEWRPTFIDNLMAYMIYETEVGEEGTTHIQGYVRFKNRKELNSAKRLICERAHLEPARGTEAQNRDYCSKDLNDVHEYGQFDGDAGRQGRRTDLEAVASSIKFGSSLQTIAATHSAEWIKYHSGITSLHQILQPEPPAVRNVTTTYIHGLTGVGKSHRIHTQYPGGYTIRAGRGPFDQYERQEVVIFEEFDDGQWPITDMLMYLDKWPCTLNCRYNNKKAFWTKVFIISNLPPSQLYILTPTERRDAFMRRLTSVVEILNKDQILFF